MKLQKEIVEILSKRYGILARLKPAGFGRRSYIKIMAHLSNSTQKEILNKVDIISSYEGKTIVMIKHEDLCEGEYFQSGDKIVLYDGGTWRNFWSVGYWKAHVDFQSMTWDDLRNWKPLKEGEYEELLALVSNNPNFWVIEKIKSLFSSK